MRVFFDTNILVYLYDNDAPEKQARSRQLLTESSDRAAVLLSTQVLQEFFVSVTRKLAVPMPSEDAERAVRRLSAFPLVQVDAPLILSAISCGRRYGFSFWDALIVQSAIQGGASTLYSEDLQHGQVVEGVRIENPYLLQAQ